MKDRQVEQTPASPRIPIVSAVLHCFSMPVIVCLRSGFGYSYLRPKIIFLAFAWAFFLLSIVAWNEPWLWQKVAGISIFGLGTSILYLIHLGIAFVSEGRGTATHDNDSGIPHAIRILKAAQVPVPRQFVSLWVIWAEPTLVLLAALALRWPFGAVDLSTWLLLTAPCLWLKEALNFWFQLRQVKRQRDALEDAEGSLNSTHAEPEADSLAANREAKVNRPRVR